MDKKLDALGIIIDAAWARQMQWQDVADDQLDLSSFDELFEAGRDEGRWMADTLKAALEKVERERRSREIAMTKKTLTHRVAFSGAVDLTEEQYREWLTQFANGRKMGVGMVVHEELQSAFDWLEWEVVYIATQEQGG